MAEREGFEPPVRFHARRFSRPMHSTTLPPLQNGVLFAKCALASVSFFSKVSNHKI